MTRKKIQYKDHIFYFPDSDALIRAGLTETELYNEIILSLETRIEETDSAIKQLQKTINEKKQMVSLDQLRSWRKRKINLKKFRKELKISLDLHQK